MIICVEQEPGLKIRSHWDTDIAHWVMSASGCNDPNCAAFKFDRSVWLGLLRMVASVREIVWTQAQYEEFNDLVKKTAKVTI